MTDDLVLTTCPYCGCGCSFYLVVVDGKVIDIAPCFSDRISLGKLCIKGREANEFIGNEQRLKTPLVRKNSQLEEVSWDEALDFIAKGISEHSKKILSNRKNIQFKSYVQLVSDCKRRYQEYLNAIEKQQ